MKAEITTTQPQSFAIDHALKTAEWEKAKGHLRAFLGIQGSYLGGGTGVATYERYTTCKVRIENFIRLFEDEGLNE